MKAGAAWPPQRCGPTLATDNRDWQKCRVARRVVSTVTGPLTDKPHTTFHTADHSRTLGRPSAQLRIAGGQPSDEFRLRVGQFYRPRDQSAGPGGEQ